ncbi:MAG: TlpA family protein disulfide reductase, partial [Phycisphaeraceae bacterium]|nr:TlpA family protein disulfide reductase [Phycisphaeraceae bacterium]
WLITHATVRHVQETPAGSMTFLVTYDLTILKHNQPLDDAMFAFDPGQAQPVRSIEALVGLGADQEHAMVGQPAPRVELNFADGKPYVMANDPAKVIVLDFWATWCGPCREALPKVQAVRDWALQRKLDVAFYAVNLRESPERVQAFVEAGKLTMPVLIDASGDVARAYGVSGIPHTAIIAGGRIVAVHVGLKPDLEAAFRDELLNILTPLPEKPTTPAP